MLGNNLTQETDSSIVSPITQDSLEADLGLTTEEKRQKIEQVFSSGQWQEEDEYEVAKIRQVVRNHIFKHVKFVKGEGLMAKSHKSNRGKRMKLNLFGKSHERPDLTCKNGYEYNIMRLVGLDEGRTSILKQALWWKTYNVHIHYEIKQLRGRMNCAMKQCLSEGENI